MPQERQRTCSPLSWSPTGKSMVLSKRSCGVTSPVWRRDTPSCDDAFLLPVSLGGSPAAGMKYISSLFHFGDGMEQDGFSRWRTAEKRVPPKVVGMRWDSSWMISPARSLPASPSTSMGMKMFFVFSVALSFSHCRHTQFRVRISRLSR